MKKSSYKKMYPPLVVIDTKKCIYNRYVGKECINIIESSELLSAENIEMFRLNPKIELQHLKEDFPAKSADFITFNFVAVRTGVEFSEVVGMV